MNTALFINGIYEGVLGEILKAQSEIEGKVFFLQPYRGNVIRMLKSWAPSTTHPIRLYISTSDNLSNICYTAEIIGWEDKRYLSNERRKEVLAHLQNYQRGECNLFEGIEEVGKKAINLISIRNLRKLDTPRPTSLLRKKSDGQPLKERTRAGGWSEVYDPGTLL
ncbi:hypothetical protein [Calidithermus chliarophilus]|uniref:hypothetical protein n=1 Tax=Calidithermus chliarophilus TaxID=52023 RepID=UPI0012F69726|nr:hypothetical protein [Calidithermus chliarophilus]